MALIKEKDYKWITCNYWTIIGYDWEKTTNKTHVTMWLYNSKEAREQWVDNYVRVDWIVLDWWNYNIEQLYAKVKESRIEQIDISVEENWEIIVKTIERENNWFADAVDW